MSAGNKHLGYKDALNDIELQSPGSKADFYFSFLRRAQELFAQAAADGTDEDADPLTTCVRCGSPSSGEVCAFCRLVERAVPVTLVERPSAPAGEARA